MRVSAERFAQLVEEAVASVPESFRPYLENVTIEILPLPDRRLLRSIDLEPGSLLLGLYQGVPLTEKSVSAPIDWPERIYIFQRNIERVCHSDHQIVQQVRHTVLHEIGHHFGMDEDDLDNLGYG